MPRVSFVVAALLALLGATNHTLAPGSHNKADAQAGRRHPASAEGAPAMDDPCQPLRDFFGETPPPATAAVPEHETCLVQPHSLLFLVATVPNPANSQLGLAFDRAIDSIQRAAQDKSYLLDRFLLPWDSESHLDEHARHTKSVQKFGIMLFRHEADDDKPDEDKPEALAVLLVPESPSYGIDPEAFDSAVGFVQRNTRRPRPNEPFVPQVFLLGPSFSSSAHSLREAMNRSGLPYTVFSGSATVPEAWRELDRPSESGFGRHFRAAVRSDDDAASALSTHLGNWGSAEWRKHGRIAVLSESGTRYGENAATKSGKDPQVLDIVFPRGISWLRNAYQDAPAANQPAVPDLPAQIRPLLPFILAEPLQGDDRPPSFSRAQTPISQETALLEIAATLRRERVRFAQIVASDALDTIFLMRFLHTYCPDVRILASEPDLLYVRAAAEFPATGAIFVTTYPLFTRSQFWTRRGENYDHRVPFVSMASEGTYNACRALIAAAADPDYQTEAAGDELLDYSYPFEGGRGSSPPVWLITLAQSGYWPLAVLSDKDLEASRAKSKLADTSDLVLRSKPADVTHGLTTEPVSFFWFTVALVLLLGAAAVATSIFTTRCREMPVLCQLSLEECADPDSPGRVFYRLCFCMCAAMMCFLTAWPVLRLWSWGPNGLSRAMACALVVAGLALIAAATRAPRTNRNMAMKRKPGNILAVALFAVLLGLWTGVFHWGPHKEDFFTAYRSLDLTNGVAPTVPFLLLVSAIMVWAWVRLKHLNFFASWPRELPPIGRAIRDEKFEEKFTRATESVALSIDAPRTHVLWFLTTVVFYFTMNQYTESLELWRFDMLYAGTFAIVIVLLARVGFQLVRTWIRFRKFLELLELHPIGDVLCRLSPPDHWGPILRRGFDIQTLTARSEGLERDLIGKCGPGFGTVIAAKGRVEAAAILRQRVLDPRWRGKPGWMVDPAAQYFALLYAVFVQRTARQLENLLTFVTAGFVLTLVSLHSYPFQASRLLGWFMAVLLIILGGGIALVLADAARNAILSRINNTTAGKVGWQFYSNLISYGALPLLAVLAAQVPSIGQFLFSWIRPALQALKG